MDAPTKEEQYAEALLRLADPFAAAMAVGFANGEAFSVAKHWPDKPEVITAKADLLAQFGEAHFLPTKYDQARAVWKDAIGALTPEDRLKAQKLYAEIMGNLAPKQEQVAISGQQEIVFRMVGPATPKVIDVSPVQKQLG